MISAGAQTKSTLSAEEIDLGANHPHPPVPQLQAYYSQFPLISGLYLLADLPPWALESDLRVPPAWFRGNVGPLWTRRPQNDKCLVSHERQKELIPDKRQLLVWRRQDIEMPENMLIFRCITVTAEYQVSFFIKASSGSSFYHPKTFEGKTKKPSWLDLQIVKVVNLHIYLQTCVQNPQP